MPQDIQHKGYFITISIAIINLISDDLIGDNAVNLHSRCAGILLL